MLKNMYSTSHIHPMLVHLPIAFSILGVLLEGIYLYKCNKFPYSYGVLLLYIATISAIIAVVTGYLFASNFVNPYLEHLKSIHSFFAVITVVTLCVTSIIYLIVSFLDRYPTRFSLYKLEIREAGFIIYILSALLVIITGYLGNILAYYSFQTFFLTQLNILMSDYVYILKQYSTHPTFISC